MKQIDSNNSSTAAVEPTDFMSKVKQRFAIFDSHHKMEQFSILFIALCLVLFGVYGYSMKVHDDNQKLHLSDTALYTKTSTFSLSGETIEIDNIYRNEDFTKSFILLHIKKGDEKSPFAKLPTDANDYQLLMTGAEGSVIHGNPSGAIYIFGNTGYMGLYFTDAAGFSNAMYQIYLQNSHIVASDVTPNPEGATYFERFNICPIYANLRGANAVVANFLAKDNPSVEEIYSELILQAKADEIIANLNTTLIGMNNCMSKINSIRKRLLDYNIALPSLPAFIGSDYVTTNPEESKSNPNAFSEAMLGDMSYLINTDYSINLGTDDESTNKYVASNDLYLVTNYVFPGGFQFNYQDLSITNGILDNLKPADMTYKEWQEKKNEEKAMYADDIKYQAVTTWNYSTSGREFVYDEAYLTPEMSAIHEETEQYNDVVRKLYELKQTYQITQLSQYLQLEVEAKSVANIFSVNATKDTLRLY